MTSQKFSIFKPLPLSKVLVAPLVVTPEKETRKGVRASIIKILFYFDQMYYVIVR